MYILFILFCLKTDNNEILYDVVRNIYIKPSISVLIKYISPYHKNIFLIIKNMKGSY